MKNNFKLDKIIKEAKKFGRQLTVDQIVIAAFVIFFALAISVRLYVNSGSHEIVIPFIPVVEERKEISKLNGLEVEVGQDNPWPMAVVVENHFDSWPQSGLENASVVYELLVEGGITRFLAIYDLSTTTEQIGPVRSVRPYFIDYMAEYPAVLSHSGGSPQGLRTLYQSDVIDHDEFANFKEFYRSERRWAPHNLYTDSERLLTARDRLVGSSTPQYGAWEFDQDFEHQDATSSSHLHIQYSQLSHTYNVDWYYDPEQEIYWREQAGQPHLMTSGEQLIADTVILMTVPAEVIDNVGRLEMDTIGRGDAYIFRNGQAVPGEWRKLSQSTRTKFYDNQGKEIDLKPGKLWIQVVKSNIEVEF